jgi:hypothetical protein
LTVQGNARYLSVELNIHRVPLAGRFLCSLLDF